MKTLIISDIHANITALDAVLNAAESFDSVWVLGDLVGYGPDPNECVDRIKTLPNVVCLMGNHDAATLGRLDIHSFNPAAQISVQWTQRKITPENIAYLQGLPESVQLDDITLAHGSPREPIWEYLLDTRNATENFDYFQTPYCFVGHTHLPLSFSLHDGDTYATLDVMKAEVETFLVPRAIINPGSVGQPRDRDPRASYMLLDFDAKVVINHRVSYDVQAVQDRMRKENLPVRHIERLSEGW